MSAMRSDVDLEFLGASVDYSSESDGSVAGAAAPSTFRRRLVLGAASAVGLLALTASLQGGAPHVATRGGTASVIGLSDKGQAEVFSATQAAATQLQSSNHMAQATSADMNDGNVCADDEEQWGGLCYASCASLSGGKYQHRQSAWTCCVSDSYVNPLSALKECKTHMGFCAGWDIAGMREGKAICPHKPGACLQDEELFLDLCFMKCSVLTAGQYPHRTAAATCCKSSNPMGCMVEDGVTDGLNGQAITNATFSVGGGCNDGKNITHCKPHQPQQALTEA